MASKKAIPVSIIHRKARAVTLAKNKERLIPLSPSALIDEYFKTFWEIFGAVLRSGHPIHAKGFFMLKIKVDDNYKHGASVRGYIKFSKKFKQQVLKVNKAGNTSLPLIIKEIIKED